MKVFTGVLIVLSSMLMLSLTACSKGGEDGVEPDNVGVSGVSLNKTELSLSVGGTETLTPTVSPSNATNKSVAWTSADPAVATVDAGGSVTAVQTGQTTITVRTADGNHTASCSVTVTAGGIAVTGVTLHTTGATLAPGEQKTLTSTIAPSTATNKNVTWASSDTAVATVDAGGRVTAVKIGTAVITVTTQDGGKTATCRVTVEATDPNNLLSTAYIPDPVFLDYCRQHTGEWDKNGDGKLYADEAAAVTTIDVANIYGNTIHSLQGIEYFTGITYLDCSLNNLASLDVSKCTRLTELYCYNNNRLGSLGLSEYTTLEFLNCSSCALTSLDVSKCTRLVDLECYFNDLTSLDVSRCTSLTILDVEGNLLVSLDVTKNRALKGLTCSNNRLTSLDLSACAALTSLNVDGNALTSLDVSKNSALILLNCDMNQLTLLDLTKNDTMESLICNNNQLSSIAVRNNTRLSRILGSNNRLNSEALNDLFEALPYSGSIAIHNNPGTSTCDLRLVQQKNWVVEAD